MIYTILALIFYTGVIMFATIASRNINSGIVAAIINTISAILPIALIIPILDKKILSNGKYGIIMAILAGIAVALYSLAMNKSLQINKVALVTPVVFGGAIFLSAILSYFFLREKVTMIQLSGLLFLGIGLILITYAAANGK